jgi:hypothetical protein
MAVKRPPLPPSQQAKPRFAMGEYSSSLPPIQEPPMPGHRDVHMNVSLVQLDILLGPPCPDGQ